MSAVSHNKHICCVTQQASLPGETTDREGMEGGREGGYGIIGGGSDQGKKKEEEGTEGGRDGGRGTWDCVIRGGICAHI